jgi:hypothetical protein
MLWYVAVTAILNLGLGYAFEAYTGGRQPAPVDMDDD